MIITEEREERTLELANRLPDMTYAEWKYVRYLINKKFKAEKKESERQLQLSLVTKDDLYAI